MKRLFIACLLALLLSAAVVIGIEYDPGYILIAWGDYTLEMTIWIGLAILFVLLLAVYLLSWTVKRSAKMGSQVGELIVNRRLRRSQKQTTQGLIAYIEGNWERSRKLLVGSAEQSDTPFLNYLFAARASHELDDGVAVRKYLSEAEDSTSGAGAAVELTQAELLLQAGQLEDCLATLKRAAGNVGKHPHVLVLLRAVYERLEDWQALLDLLPDLKKHDLIDEAGMVEQQRACAKGLLSATAERNRQSEALLGSLQHVWQGLPKHLNKDSEVLALYAEYLMLAGAHAEAEKCLRHQLKRDWSRRMVQLYGLLEIEPANKALSWGESCLKEHAGDPVLLLTLGRLSLRNELWGKARDYFESSYELERSPEVCAELGRLLAHLGEHELSYQCYEEGMMLNTRELPGLPMPRLRLQGPDATAEEPSQA